MERRNMPSGQVAVLLSHDDLAFIIQTCEANERFAMNHLIGLSTLPPEAFTDDFKESFLKLDALKNQYRDLREKLEGQVNE